MKVLVAIAVLCVPVTNLFRRGFKISTDTLFYILIVVSGIAVIIFNVYKKRYYGELAVVIFTLIMSLFMLRFFLSNSISPLQAIIGLLILCLAIIASSVRLVRKIMKQE